MGLDIFPAPFINSTQSSSGSSKICLGSSMNLWSVWIQATISC
jgi:hypothetical protein